MIDSENEDFELEELDWESEGAQAQPEADQVTPSPSSSSGSPAEDAVGLSTEEGGSRSPSRPSTHGSQGVGCSKCALYERRLGKMKEMMKKRQAEWNVIQAARKVHRTSEEASLNVLRTLLIDEEKEEKNWQQQVIQELRRSRQESHREEGRHRSHQKGGKGGKRSSSWGWSQRRD